MQTLDKKEISTLTERLKKLGYGIRKRVHIYGEELELTSDPMPHENTFLVEGKSRRSGKSKRLKIPLSILQMVRSQSRLAKTS
jgi:hypothetical protein